MTFHPDGTPFDAFTDSFRQELHTRLVALQHGL